MRSWAAGKYRIGPAAAVSCSSHSLLVEEVSRGKLRTVAVQVNGTGFFYTIRLKIQPQCHLPDPRGPGRGDKTGEWAIEN